jgi:hypothetical protein
MAIAFHLLEEPTGAFDDRVGQAEAEAFRCVDEMRMGLLIEKPLNRRSRIIQRHSEPFFPVTAQLVFRRR